MNSGETTTGSVGVVVTGLGLMDVVGPADVVGADSPQAATNMSKTPAVATHLGKPHGIQRRST
jgi:hypothetical protein